MDTAKQAMYQMKDKCSDADVEPGCSGLAGVGCSMDEVYSTCGKYMQPMLDEFSNGVDNSTSLCCLKWDKHACVTKLGCTESQMMGMMMKMKGKIATLPGYDMDTAKQAMYQMKDKCSDADVEPGCSGLAGEGCSMDEVYSTCGKYMQPMLDEFS